MAVLGIPGWSAVRRRPLIAEESPDSVRAAEAAVSTCPLLASAFEIPCFGGVSGQPTTLLEGAFDIGLAKKAAVFLRVRSLVVGDVVLARCLDDAALPHCTLELCTPPVPCTCV